MKKTFQPMLASTVTDVNDIVFPCLVSPKLDGYRAVVANSKLLSRNLKDIPNNHVRKMFSKAGLNSMDGELICGDPCSPTAFRDTQSAVASVEGKPDVTFFVFDSFTDPTSEFVRRHASLKTRLKTQAFGVKVVVVPHVEVKNLEELIELEEKWLAMGYEGMMGRSRNGQYKFGRATPTQGWLWKLKRFADSEAVILDAEEQMANHNEAKKDALGRTERSSKKAGMVGKGTLGALVVKDLKTGAVFNVGTGMSDELRAALWLLHKAGKLVGKVVKYRYFPSGSKDLPRFPVFVGFRDATDL